MYPFICTFFEWYEDKQGLGIFTNYTVISTSISTTSLLEKLQSIYTKSQKILDYIK